MKEERRGWLPDGAGRKFTLSLIIVGCYVLGVETLSVVAFLRWPVETAWPIAEKLNEPMPELVGTVVAFYFIVNASQNGKKDNAGKV